MCSFDDTFDGTCERGTSPTHTRARARNRRSTLIIVTYESGGRHGEEIGELISFYDEKIEHLAEEHGLSATITTGTTGIQPFADAILDGISSDLEVRARARVCCVCVRARARACVCS